LPPQPYGGKSVCISHFNQYFPSYFFIGQGEILTLPTILFSKVVEGRSLDAIGAEVAILLSIPGLTLLIVTERFLKEEIFAKSFGG